MHQFEVVCGNIGSVYSGDSRTDAQTQFREYVAASKAECGRAGGEDVTLFMDGEIVREHIGSLHDAEIGENP